MIDVTVATVATGIYVSPRQLTAPMSSRGVFSPRELMVATVSSQGVDCDASHKLTLQPNSKVAPPTPPPITLVCLSSMHTHTQSHYGHVSSW